MTSRPKGNLVPRSKVEPNIPNIIHPKVRIGETNLQKILEILKGGPHTLTQIKVLARMSPRSTAYYLSYLQCQKLIKKEFCGCCQVGVLYRLVKK